MCLQSEDCFRIKVRSMYSYVYGNGWGEGFYIVMSLGWGLDALCERGPHKYRSTNVCAYVCKSEQGRGQTISSVGGFSTVSTTFIMARLKT